MQTIRNHAMTVTVDELGAQLMSRPSRLMSSALG